MCSEVNDTIVDTLECIGIDGKIHRYVPWKDSTICEISIGRKKTSKEDRVHHYYCSICDAYQDERDYT